MSTILSTHRPTPAPTTSSSGRAGGGWLPGSRLIGAEVLKLRRRRGLMTAGMVLAPGVVIVVFVIRAILHLTDPAHYGPAGGLNAFGNMSFALSELGAIVAIMIGASAGSSDLSAGVFRSLVVTGKSRWALFTARIPAGLAVLVPIIAVAFTLISVSSVALAGNTPAPSIGVMFWSGLWVELGAVVLFAIALGVASVIGNRSTTLGVLLAVQLVLTPIFMRTSGFNDIRQLLPGIVLQQLQPAALGRVGPRGGLTMTGPSIAVLIVLWTFVPLVIGAWRTARRDA